MLIGIDVLPEFTQYKENANVNIKITVDLSTVWEEIKGYDRFGIRSTIDIPVIKNGKRVISQVCVTNHYTPLELTMEEKDYLLTQYGYYEGELDQTGEIVGKSNIWVYRQIGIEDEER